ncbi:MAG: MATE family efflux transporter [Clostridia bacterium]|nr:MATE family efflux transporter [Clostridia bacterium]
MSKTDNEFLGREPIGKLLLRLSLPAVAGQLINMLYNIVDRIYIGHMPEEGALALTGVGVCLPVILIVSAFAALVASGGAPRASIAMGRGDQAEAERIMGNCFSLLLCVSAVLTVLLLLFHKPLLLAFGASENTIVYAAPYMMVYSIGTVFVQITLGMNAFITAQGFAKTAMLTTCIGAVCNIVLDPVFIFAFDMGVKGAALATILSQEISALWVVRFLSGEKSILRLGKGSFRLEWQVLLPCLALGLAPFVMQISESVIFVCYNSSLLKYGGDIAVGAMTILTSVMQFAMMPLNGLGQGAQPITSYNFGAGNRQRVKDTFFLLLKVSLTHSMLMWALIQLFPGLFVSIFTSDPALHAFAIRALRIYCAVLGIFGIQMACQMTFTAIGNAKCSILVAVMRKFILLVPLIYIMPLLVQDKTTGVYLSEPVADVISVCFCATLFFFAFRKALKGMEAAEKI